MFSTKNISPRQLSFITALLLAVPMALLVFFIEKSWFWGLRVLFIVFSGDPIC